ncbi:MAG: radical SAM protein [Tannerellaceae bacterium]|jgi:radical SAM superfamily enzyme YgiQ (UPF0313 family)|nr:radical SAM protein [Tannerellaceae bacterium]
MNILLNWFPPAFKKIPSPSMSILKGYLNQQGYNSFVCYWNLILRDIIQSSTGLGDEQEANEFDIIVPFLPLLLNNEENRETFDRLCAYHQSKFPQYFNINKQGYYETALHDCSNQILNRINDITNQLYFEKNPDLVCVNISLLQLIPANIFSSLSKINHPDIPIIAGGISNKKEAIAVLDNFSCYDFAIWGEGENPLHQLCRSINREISLEKVPNLAYRIEGDIIANQRNKTFSRLDIVKPDYTDYFRFINDNRINEIQPLIPVESSRGCHWNQCKFCFLTEGYRNRAKNNDAIINEIIHSIEAYNIFEFVFLDNDIIFNDKEKFDDLLNQFIKIKDKHEQFGIWNGEVVTKGLNASIIKKMTLAGFKSIQIGYEAITDSLLKKINKKNSFSSNLMFVKWASEYSLNLQGLNIITGLIGEDDGDIKTSIKNLHFLRFFLSKAIKHEIIPLQIMRASRYYKELKDKNELDQWDSNFLYSLFPHRYIKAEHKFDIMFFSKKERNILWNNLESINKHYFTNDYKYKIYSSDNELIQYIEILNGSNIAKLEFNTKDNCHWSILHFCNKEVKSVEQIIAHFDLQDNITEQGNIKKALVELNNEFLLYSNSEFSENITIINTDFVL